MLQTGGDCITHTHTLVLPPTADVQGQHYAIGHALIMYPLQLCCCMAALVVCIAPTAQDTLKAPTAAGTGQDPTHMAQMQMQSQILWPCLQAPHPAVSP